MTTLSFKKDKKKSGVKNKKNLNNSSVIKNRTATAPPLPSSYTPVTNKNSGRFLWLAVFSGGIIILGTLLWSLKLQLHLLNWERSPEKILLDNGNKSWEKAIAATETGTDLQQEINKGEIKEIVEKIFQNSGTVSTTTSSENNLPSFK